MIEINLLPGTTKRAAKKGFSFGMGRRGPAPDKGTGGRRANLLPVLVWVAAIGAIAYLHLSSGNRLSALRTEQEAAQRDSARYALLRAQGDSLADREAVIARKMQLIQDIDAGRFTWAHILDEISRALPDYIWIASVSDLPVESQRPHFRIDGRAGNYYAIGKYIEDLEASPFLMNVRLMSSTRTIMAERAVLQFVLEMDYQDPPPDAIQTVPLFAATPQEN